MRSSDSSVGVCAIILAAGIGSRMKSDITKQQMNILGRSVLYHSVMAFEACDSVDSMVVVVRSDEMDFARRELASFSKPCVIVPGGETRRESARIGFDAVPEGTALVAIHDAARPLITPAAISAVIDAARISGAATAVSRVIDTVKRVDDTGYIVETVARESLRRAETPQVFSADLYRRAIEKCESVDDITDDNMMLENIGIKVMCVETACENIKITVPDDAAYAEFVLRRRSGL